MAGGAVGGEGEDEDDFKKSAEKSSEGGPKRLYRTGGQLYFFQSISFFNLRVFIKE